MLPFANGGIGLDCDLEIFVMYQDYEFSIEAEGTPTESLLLRLDADVNIGKNADGSLCFTIDLSDTILLTGATTTAAELAIDNNPSSTSR